MEFDLDAELAEQAGVDNALPSPTGAAGDEADEDSEEDNDHGYEF